MLFMCEKEGIMEKKLFEVDIIIWRNERLFIFRLLFVYIYIYIYIYAHKVMVRSL